MRKRPGPDLQMQDVLLACGELSERERVAVRWVLDQHNTRMAEVVNAHEKLRAELLTSDTFLRVTAWLKDPHRKAAGETFTAGIERQICYLLEQYTIPHVRALEARNAIPEADLETATGRGRIQLPIGKLTNIIEP